jgi:hypothetical protein
MVFFSFFLVSCFLSHQKLCQADERALLPVVASKISHLNTCSPPSFCPIAKKLQARRRTGTSDALRYGK